MLHRNVSNEFHVVRCTYLYPVADSVSEEETFDPCIITFKSSLKSLRASSSFLGQVKVKSLSNETSPGQISLVKSLVKASFDSGL